MKSKKYYDCLLISINFLILCFLVLFVITLIQTKSMSESLSDLTKNLDKPGLTDRKGVDLTFRYISKWNYNDQAALHEIPVFLQNVFILSEDKNFYKHNGVDWSARISALWQNIKAGKTVRGASTITEQVVRMIHVRKRSIRSRWLEGFEALNLEKKQSKSDILEFS